MYTLSYIIYIYIYTYIYIYICVYIYIYIYIQAEKAAVRPGADRAHCDGLSCIKYYAQSTY